MMSFLCKTTGFKIAGVKEGGSRGKQTDIRMSDMDIIYTTSKDKDANKMKQDLINKWFCIGFATGITFGFIIGFMAGLMKNIVW